MKEVRIYADGSARSTGGSGGWAALLLAQVRGEVREKEISGGYRWTNHNRMELRAAVEALGALKEPCMVIYYGDAEYVVKTMQSGKPRVWKQARWTKTSNEPVKNADLWELLLEAAQPHDITWQWVPGHKGVVGNERVDKLAGAANMRAAELAAQGMTGTVFCRIDTLYEELNPYRPAVKPKDEWII